MDGVAPEMMLDYDIPSMPAEKALMWLAGTLIAVYFVFWELGAKTFPIRRKQTVSHSQPQSTGFSNRLKYAQLLSSHLMCFLAIAGCKGDPGGIPADVGPARGGDQGKGAQGRPPVRTAVLIS